MQLHFNPQLAAIEPSAIRAMHERKRATSIDLGMGQPTLMPDPQPFVRATEWVRVHGCPYSPNLGLAELRERIANIYGGRHCGVAANVCVTNGSQEAIYLSVKTLLQPGADEVLITDPTYPSYGRVADLEGVRCHHAVLDRADGFALRADPILAALTPQTKLIMLGSPANPTGAVMSLEEMRTLVRALEARPGPPVYVMVDEVYRELLFAPEPYPSILDLYPFGIAVQSLSKSCALTGLRLGFLFGPAAFIEAASRLHALVLMSVNMFAQHVALEIVSTPFALRAHVAWYQAQRETLLETADALALPIIPPTGAFYALLALPEGMHNSAHAADDLLETHDVVTIPGSVFGNAGEGFLRLTWAAPEPQLREGLSRIARFLKTV